MGNPLLREYNDSLKHRNVGVVVPTLYTDPNSRPCIRGIYAGGSLVVPDKHYELPEIGTFVQVREFTDLTQQSARGLGVVFARCRTIAPERITPRLFDYDPSRPLRADWESMRWEKIEGRLLRVERRGSELIAVLQFRYALVWRDHHDQFTMTFFPVGMWSDWNKEERRALVVEDWTSDVEDDADRGAVTLCRNWDSIGDYPRTKFPLRVFSVKFPGWGTSGNPRFHIATPCEAEGSVLEMLETLEAISR